MHKLPAKPEGIEAFPKEDIAEEIGDIYSTSEEFQSLPRHIQWRIVAEKFLQNFLLETEDKNEMIAKYGSVEKLCLFVRERVRLRFLARYGHFEGPNKYEIN